jgi:hypothetical protein
METINPLRRAMAAQKTRNNINSNIQYYRELFEQAKQSVLNNPANPMLQKYYNEKMVNVNKSNNPKYQISGMRQDENNLKIPS